MFTFEDHQIVPWALTGAWPFLSSQSSLLTSRASSVTSEGKPLQTKPPPAEQMSPWLCCCFQRPHWKPLIPQLLPFPPAAWCLEVRGGENASGLE